MAAQLTELAPDEFQLITLNAALTKPGEVLCDVCMETKRMALKSCLICLASFCETHLEPHHRVSSLNKHKLIDPVEKLEDRVCKNHERPLELFCRGDQMCVCHFCTETDHKTHDTVLIEEEFGERKTQMAKTVIKVEQMVQERLQKVKDIEQAVELSKEDAEAEIADSIQVFAGLVSSIERIQVELVMVVREKQKAAERQAEGLIKELEQEISELKKRRCELEQLSDIEDHLQLLQSSPLIYTALPPTKNWSEINVHSDLHLGTVQRAIAQLEKALNKEIETFPEIKLKRIQQYAVDVTLDPNTSYPYLILSGDLKKVRYGDIKQEIPDNPERFDCHPRVLGKEGFSSGRFYYEVQVMENTWWALGVASDSINRKGQSHLNPLNGAWTVELRNGSQYGARMDNLLPLSLRERPQKVGVFVDYEEGLVSFYNVEAKSHIYSFTNCMFTGSLYPLLSLPNPSGDNSAPMIIYPVKFDNI